MTVKSIAWETYDYVADLEQNKRKRRLCSAHLVLTINCQIKVCVHEWQWKRLCFQSGLQKKVVR